MFLRELEANNDRTWFKENRARYDRCLVEPARELAETLADLGTAHFFRPYNDTRFHMRPPLKEHLGVAIGYGGAGGYYVELSLDGLLVAAGLHSPAPDQLGRFRAGHRQSPRRGVRACGEDRRRPPGSRSPSPSSSARPAAIRSITRGSTGCG